QQMSCRQPQTPTKKHQISEFASYSWQPFMSEHP
ncbi:MAG: hypothetical protein ACI9KM_000449, partial [Rubritalea sp.]